MEPHSVTLCLLHASLKWPQRLNEILHCVDAPPTPDPVYFALWKAVLRVHSTCPTLSPEVFREQVLFAIRTDAPAYSGAAAQLVNHVATATAPTEQFCMDILKRHAMQRVLENYSTLDSSNDVQTLLSKLSSINGMAQAGCPGHVRLFENDGRDFLIAERPVHLGFPIFDDTFGGLFPPGRLVLFVIPTKAGKTLLSMQISKCLVQLNLPVLYMNFEQDARGDIAVRVYMMASDTTKSDWENKTSFTELSPEVEERLRRNIPQWNQFFFPYTADVFSDPQALNKGAESIRRILLSHFGNQNSPIPSLIIIDWWRTLWDRVKSSLPGRVSESELRSLELAHFLQLKKMAQDLDTRVLVFMQMRAEIGTTLKADDVRKLSVADAAENKALAQYADAGFVTTRVHPDSGDVSVKLDVCRFRQGGYIRRFHMDGEHQLYVPLDSMDSPCRADESSFNTGGMMQQ